jgi:hypothetical protein
LEHVLTPKERMLRALRGETPDVWPAAPCYLSLFLANTERAAYIEQYRLCLNGRSRLSVDHPQDTLFRARALVQAYRLFQNRPDWIEVQAGASHGWADRTDIVLHDGVLCYEDRTSGVRVPMDAIPLPRGDAPLSPGNAATQDVWDVSAQFSGPDDVDAALPVLSAEDWLARGDLDLPRLVLADYGDTYFIHTILDTPFSDAYDWLGFQGLMLLQRDRPAVLHHLLQRRLAQDREILRAWAQVGVPGVFVEEVFTGADMISPRSYDEFVFAYNRPYFQHMRASGLLPIHYVCGNAIPRLERMVTCDVAAVAVEESKKNFRLELEEVIRRVAGRAAVFGNIDAVRFGIHTTAEELTAEVIRQAGIGASARGFVVSTGSPFPLDTDPRRIDALVAAAHTLSPGAPEHRGRQGMGSI